MIGWIQGTGVDAVVSAGNLDYSVHEVYHGSADELVYGTVRLQPAIFQDDICRVVGTLQEAQAGSIKLDMVMKSKQLCMQPDKTGYIIFGAKGKCCKGSNGKPYQV